LTLLVTLAAVSASMGQRTTAQAATPDPSATATNPASPEVRIDPKADRILHQMSDRLASMSRFGLQTHNTIEFVTKDGEKVEYDSDSRTYVERPNKLRTERTGEVAKLQLFYDGKTLTLFESNRNYYAQAKAPPDLDNAMDFARSRLNLEAPIADLLYTDVYRGLIEDVVRGDYVGEATIEGSPCHHLAFRARKVDWQVWVDTDTMLPRRYLLITKDVRGSPEYSVVIEKWILDPGPVDFTFQPPPGARQIEFFGAPDNTKDRG
jgi:hypothetical protein